MYKNLLKFNSMNKRQIIVAICLLINIFANAQFTDDFESYTDGEPIYGGWWSSWGCGEELGCALEATSAQAHNGKLSGLVPGDGTSSPDLDLGEKTSGKWALEFYLLIPENKEGYFSLHGQFPIVNGEWIVGNFFFNQNLANPGVGIIDDSALGVVEYNFPHGEWFRVIINVDLTGGMTEGTWEYIVDGVVVIPEGTPFTQSDGTVPTNLGAVSLFSISINSELYMDDLRYINGEILNTQEVSTTVALTLYPNPAQDFIMLETEAAIQTIIIYDLQGKIVMKKEVINNVGISELTRGLYFIEVQTDHGKAVRRFFKN